MQRIAQQVHLGVVAMIVSCGQVSAQVDENGFEWATITHAGNAAYEGPGFSEGRGRVDHEYRMAVREVSTLQWMNFINHYTTQSDELARFGDPAIWGAVQDPTYSGPGRRYRLSAFIPDAANVPVYGITWRDAARYVNWLHNGGGSDLSSIADGAYDASTFITNPDLTFQDQPTRSAGARYWIPSLDEWLKAAHFDPHRHGEGQPGWWTYSNTSEIPPVGGPPGAGEANAGFHLPNFREYLIPLGSYPQTQTPWGLLDAAGCAGEWTEEIIVQERVFDGSWAALDADTMPFLDQANYYSSLPPTLSATFAGLRIAAVIPTPHASCLVVLIVVSTMTKRRRT